MKTPTAAVNFNTSKPLPKRSPLSKVKVQNIKPKHHLVQPVNFKPLCLNIERCLKPLNLFVWPVSGTFAWNLDPKLLCGTFMRNLYVKLVSGTFITNLFAKGLCGTFLWNLGTYLCGTWKLVRVEPLCGTLGNLTLYVEPAKLLRVEP